jgi:selenocysteine lyase/cysteine desulfurase
VSSLLADLQATPNPVAAHYRAARVSERALLTGHSHQAWPDVAVEAVAGGARAALELLDDKWERAFAQADAVRRAYAGRLQDPGAEIALGVNTHELIVRLLSALDLRARPRIVTTDGEFHTLRRQLARLAEAGLEIERVPAGPVETLAARLAAACDRRTAAVMVSAVLFETAAVVPGLDEVARAAAREGAELVVDAYHALGPVPFDVTGSGLSDAWVVGGGYKYLQLGEGNCFLRVPAHADTLRPVITGWFAEFDALADTHAPERVAYGHGAGRFAGATYDPLSHDRAVAVGGFFAEQGWDAPTLCAAYRHQVGVLADAFDALDADPALIDRDRAVEPAARGGFLALRTPSALALRAGLRQRGVLCDARGTWLRLGPAPYVSDAQLRDAVGALGDVLRAA